MKIRTKIAFQYTLIVGLTVIVFATLIYILSAQFRAQEFYARLNEKAVTTAKFLADVNEIDDKLLKIIDYNSLQVLPEEQIIIFNENEQPVYIKNEKEYTTIPPALIHRIKNEKEVRFRQGNHEVLGILYPTRYRDFIVIASAYDKYGIRKLSFLRNMLISGCVLTLIFTWVVGLIFSKQSLRPISNMVTEIEKINISSLGSELDTGNGKDEIAQLATKFNEMFSRLHAAFEMQQSFVTNASHELRTPLTALTGQIEVAMMNPELNDDTRKIFKSLLEDVKSLNQLSNGLLDLARVNLDISKIKMNKIRIDELMGQVQSELLKRHPGYTVHLSFSNFPEYENQMLLNGNEQLLKTAISNVLSNACKYSENHTAWVTIDFTPTGVVIQTEDQGIGIDEHELKKIIEPFYRSPNAMQHTGHGIGLSLTAKIVELHEGSLMIYSKLNKGTSVTITLPYHISSRHIYVG